MKGKELDFIQALKLAADLEADKNLEFQKELQGLRERIKLGREINALSAAYTYMKHCKVIDGILKREVGE